MDIPISIGRYEILERVARGGMGALYRARDPVLEREVAIKVMLADFSHDANGRTRFYREARAIARLQHRNIVTLFDYGEDEGNPFIVMEFLQGQTLAARVKHGPPVPLVQALATGAQLCTGLHFAHGSGIVHRDVKPANIWLEDDGGVKLLDFGIAKFGDTDVTQAGDVLGSISYMSPEQLSGSSTIDGRSDIFSAGIVMYELLTGRRPFQGESPTAIMMKIIHEEAPPLDAVPGAPPKLRTLIGKALEKNPEKRYQRAAEFASELRDLQLSIERQQERQQEAPRTASGSTATVPAAQVPAAAPPQASAGAHLPAAQHPAASQHPGVLPHSAAPGAALSGASSPGGSQAGASRPTGGARPGGAQHGAVPPGSAQPGAKAGGANPGGAASVPAAMLRSGEMVTATHTPAPLPRESVSNRPPNRPQNRPAGPDALLIRPANVSGLDSEDPLSDVMIGGRDDLPGSRDDAAAAADESRRAGTGSRPAWVPIGAAAAAILAIVATFLFMRGAPIEVAGGAQGHDASSSPSSTAVKPSAPGAGSASGNAAGSSPYPDTGRIGGPADGGKTGSGSSSGSGSDPTSASSTSASASGPTGPDSSHGAPPSSSPSSPSSPGAGAGAGSAPPTTPNAAMVHVTLTGSYPFEVSGESGVLSRARTRHELELSRPQTLRLRAAEYGLDRRVEVTAKPGETVRLFAPALGRLTVRTTYETCQIFLGGLALGYPPLAERPVASGTYRLTLRCPDGDHQTQTVTIPAGATHMALIQ